MRFVGLPSVFLAFAASCGWSCVSPANASPQSGGPITLRGTEFAPKGQVTVEVQDATGAAFFEGATVTLLTRDAGQKVFTTSDPSGKASFSSLPVGQYLLEIVAPGYRTVEQQVLLSSANESQRLVVSMLPSVTYARKPGEKPSTSPQAVKEAEKALHALELNHQGEAEQHISLALSFDPNFADGNYLMGVLLLRKKDTAQAGRYLQKAVSISPEHAPALLALGEAQYSEHDYAHASESLEKYLRLQPHGPQAPTAQKYVDTMRGWLQAHSPSDPTGSAGAPPADDVSKLLGRSTPDRDENLPPLPEIAPDTETNWAPPDVDSERIELDSSAPCELNRTLQSAGRRIQELVQNVDRFTATEEIDHSNLSPMGLLVSEETRKFNYVVEIRRIEKTDLDVREYRNGSVSTDAFPAHIATVGLPSLALIFHPYLKNRYEFSCEGRSDWQGRSAWVLRFEQRKDQSSGMLVYHVGSRFVSVGLKGRAWVDAKTSQVLAMESDILHPIPEIRLLRDHQLIEYGPVSFKNKSMDLWLPKSADWYCSFSGRRFHRRHSFSNFLLFSVDDQQTISKPAEPDSPE
jgi:tetratricopeptide (TPR) repeat protein